MLGGLLHLKTNFSAMEVENTNKQDCKAHRSCILNIEIETNVVSNSLSEMNTESLLCWIQWYLTGADAL